MKEELGSNVEAIVSLKISDKILSLGSTFKHSKVI
jgi:hypothetical protein